MESITSESHASPAPHQPLALSDTMKANERVATAFAQLQAEIDALQAAALEHEKRAQELEQRDAALRDYATQLGEREFHLADRHRELNEAQERLNAEASQWRQSELEMRAKQEALDTRERAIGEQQAAAESDQQSVRRIAHGFEAEHRWLATRRARLRRQRQWLAERAEQLVRAKEALAQRLADSARMRALSGTMTPGAAPAGQGHAAIAGSFGMFMGGGAFALTVIAGLSWWIAGEIDHPVYLAQARLVMEKANTEPGIIAVESWQQFHEDLAGDPMLLEQAADRLRRRGYEDLGTPVDLSHYLRERLTLDSPEPGALSLTLLGEGRQRTQNILETMTGALVSIANDSRERRLDRSSTMVELGAHAGESPVQSARLPLFGMTAAALTLVCSMVGLAGARAASRPRNPQNKAAFPDEEGGEERWTIPTR